MKDQFKNPIEPEETFSEILKSVVQKIELNASFKAELGKQLMEAHQPAPVNFILSAFNRAMPAFGWVFALALMALVLNWVFRSIAPLPIPAALETPAASTRDTPSPSPTQSTTPAPEDGGYNWRGTKLYLAQSLPESPAEANVYLLKEDRHATVDEARALAQRFRIEGEVYQGPGDIAGTTDYIITDGKQKLQVRSDNYFTYYSDFDNFTLGKIPEEQAIIAIDNFLKKYGFDFEYHVASAAEMTGQQYYITPLTSDNAEIRSDYMMPVRFEITIDSTGQNIIFAGYPINYEAIGMFRIITAAEAFQSMLTPNPQFGIMESVRGNGGGGGGGTGFFKLNLSGTPVPFPSPTTQPQTNEGTVQYVVQEGDTVLAIAQDYGTTPEKIVQANSWLSDGHVLTPGKTLIIPGAHSNSELVHYIVKEGDTLNLIAQNHGISVDKLMEANGITDPIIFIGQTLIIPGARVTSGQGIILPEEQLIQFEIGQRLEDERGIFQVNIYQPSQRIWYGFYKTDVEKGNIPYIILESADLQNLQKYNNLPINIWGTIDRFDQYGKPIVKVDRYEFPFPDLKFQILEGTQKIVEILGKQVLTFTASTGTTYVQIGDSVYPLDQNSLFGNEGEVLLLEGLIVPDEVFGGYPTVRMFSMSYAVDPISGQANEMTITADQFNTYDEPQDTTKVYAPPTATIETVELVYYIPDPRYAPTDSNSKPQYIQPAWRFYGHYSNGDEFEILVQALKEEYLLPELAPYTPPG